MYLLLFCSYCAHMGFIDELWTLDVLNSWAVVFTCSILDYLRFSFHLVRLVPPLVSTNVQYNIVCTFANNINESLYCSLGIELKQLKSHRLIEVVFPHDLFYSTFGEYKCLVQHILYKLRWHPNTFLDLNANSHNQISSSLCSLYTWGPVSVASYPGLFSCVGGRKGPGINCNAHA